jgi:carbamoyltransferase
MNPTHRMILQHDTQFGHRFVPGQRARVPNERGGYYVVTNADGFRSDFDFARPRSGRPRVLVFGDSYTAGDGCDNGERFTDRLGEALGAEVFNYGLSGTGTDQQLLIFEQLARDVEADLILICPCVENIERIQVAYRESIDRVTGRRLLMPKPYFTLEGDGLRLHQVPVPRERPDRDAVGDARVQTKIPAGMRLVYEALDFYRKSPSMGWARGIVNSALPDLRSQLLRASGYQPHRDYESADSPGWRLMRAILERFFAGASPRPVVVVPLPTYHFFFDGVPPIYLPRYASLEDRARGVHVLDVTTPLLALPRDTRRDLRFRKDYHYSPEGHRRVAELVASGIRERGLLSGGNGRPSSPATAPASSAGAATTPRRTARPRGERPDGHYVLGVSCFYHNSAAALIRDGQIVAAAEEERFTRLKNDRRFPHQAANYCLEAAGIHQNHLDAIAYYDNTGLTFERILHTLLAVAPKGETAWQRVMPPWLRYKLQIPDLIRSYMHYEGPILQGQHHRSHAASAFYPSPYDRAALLTIDGVGEWATAAIGSADENGIRLLKEMRFPHSLGLLYSAFTQFTGFKVNSGEYKMMGLAPYGEAKYTKEILDHLIDLKADGSVELNLDYFAYLTEPTTTNEKFAALFGGPARKPDAPITKREMDLSKSIQAVTEEAMLRMARHARELTGEKYLCLAGGVALNCVANGRILRESPFEDLWIQPAAGDSGCALGVALDAHHAYFGRPRPARRDGRPMQGGSYWGPRYSTEEVRAFLDTHGYAYREMKPEERASLVAAEIAKGKVIGHLCGGLEYGPRSLGARSILGDARNSEMQVNLNLKIKYRESFRPFAPTVLSERVGDYFELDRESPYMLLVAPVKASRRKPFELKIGDGDMLPIVRELRSDIPAVTHVDYSARVQTIARPDHPQYYDLIRSFEQATGYAVLVNTSFNVRGEPIVCTPYDAYRCFMRTEMDVLVLENFMLMKDAQPSWPEEKGHIEEYGPDAGPEADEAFAEDLRQFHAGRFLDVARRLREQHAVQFGLEFRRAPSLWTDVESPDVRRQDFDLPEPPKGAAGEFAAAAAALSRDWKPGPATDALRPLLADLLATGRKHLGEQTLSEDEEIPENVYVLY